MIKNINILINLISHKKCLIIFLSEKIGLREVYLVV